MMMFRTSTLLSVTHTVIPHIRLMAETTLSLQKNFLSAGSVSSSDLAQLNTYASQPQSQNPVSD